MIKLDIINEVVNRTGITKTKAEMAVETVFESMKRSLSKGDRIELYKDDNRMTAVGHVESALFTIERESSPGKRRAFKFRESAYVSPDHGRFTSR